MVVGGQSPGNTRRNLEFFKLKFRKANCTIHLTEYCAGGKFEKNEMGGACSAYGGGVHRYLVGKPGGKRPLGRPRRRWEDNTKMDL